jgi:hypothetical protein
MSNGATNVVAGLILFAGFVVVCLILASPFVGYSWYASCREARVYNSQNGTNFTCGDFFWAEDQINTRTQSIRIK